MRASLYEVFRAGVALQPDRTALVEGHTSLTYAELAGQVEQLADEFRRLGVGRGDRVVICAGNRAETVIAFWAAMGVGGVPVVIGHEQSRDRVRYILDDSGAVALVASATLALQLALDGRPTALRALVLIDAVDGTDRARSGFADVDEATFPDPASGIPPKTGGIKPAGTISEDLASIVYTSGSTGQAKGVMLNHANMLTALASLNQYLENTSDDIFLCVLPLAFDYGLYQMIMAFSVGATLVLERDLSLPLQALNDIARYRCTVVPGVPVFFELLDRFSRFGVPDLSSVRCVTNTGAALLSRHIDAVRRIFPGAAIYSMYGVTECKRCTYLPPHLLEEKPASVGVAIPNTEIVVVDEHDQPCQPFEVGQLVVRGGTVMQGYWQLPEETSRTIREHPIRGGRCLYTGDYGYLDEDGCFYFTSRMDEVVKVRGRKLVPRTVEDALRGLPGVLDAAVLCTAATEGEYEVVAYVEGDPADINASTLRTGCQQVLENFEVPHRFEVLTALPRNTNGKVDKPGLGLSGADPECATGGTAEGALPWSA